MLNIGMYCVYMKIICDLIERNSGIWMMLFVIVIVNF